MDNAVCPFKIRGINMYKKKKNGLVGIIIMIGILIILVVTTNGNVDKFSKAENLFNKMVTPMQNCLVYLKNKRANNTIFLKNIEVLQAENEELQKQNQEMQKLLDELELIKAENEILREYVNLSEQYVEYTTIGAYIINKNTSNFTDTFIINIGTDHGVTTNMAVIAKEGLVGYVISTTNKTAKVQPIIDAASSVSGITNSSRANVIVSGQVDSEKELKVYTLQLEDEIIKGDIIETSGLGGIYPKGITIGTIKEIIETKNVTEKYAILETKVDFKNLEYVLVIKQ